MELHDQAAKTQLIVKLFWHGSLKGSQTRFTCDQWEAIQNTASKAKASLPWDAKVYVYEAAETDPDVDPSAIAASRQLWREYKATEDRGKIASYLAQYLIAAAPPAAPEATELTAPFVATSTSQARRVFARLLKQSTDPVFAELKANLLDATGRFKGTKGISHEELMERPDLVEMMHVESASAGGTRVVIGGAWENQFDRVTVEGRGPKKSGWVVNEAVSIGPWAVERRTAQNLESIGWLRKGTVANAPRIK